MTMMAHEYYIYTGRDGERVPRHVTHILIDKALKFVPARAFDEHPNIQELICHDGVEKIEQGAFCKCRSLRRVIMPGVKEVGERAFQNCSALTFIECGKLEIIGKYALGGCYSLTSIDLPSVKIVGQGSFTCCLALIKVKFGKDLESIGGGTFYGCTSLERIALPLKDGMITDDRVFQGCVELVHVDLAGGVHGTIAALLMDEWKHDMNEEIDTFRPILRNTPAGALTEVGEKAQAIRAWIRSFLSKYNRYKAEHRRYVNEAAATLQLALPTDIVLKNVLPFVELPSDTFEGED